jgi:hypothetical protein
MYVCMYVWMCARIGNIHKIPLHIWRMLGGSATISHEYLPVRVYVHTRIHTSYKIVYIYMYISMHVHTASSTHRLFVRLTHEIVARPKELQHHGRNKIDNSQCKNPRNFKIRNHAADVSMLASELIVALFMYVCMHVCMYGCMCVCMDACVYVCMPM